MKRPFTIIYVNGTTRPRFSYKTEILATSKETALELFSADRRSAGKFIAAVVEGKASKVHFCLFTEELL